MALFFYADINECNVSPPVCAQVCSNTHGGYQCSCIAGYKLHADNHSCTAFGKLKLNVSQR